MYSSLPIPGQRMRAASRRLTLVLVAGAVALAGLTVSARDARASDAEDILRFLAGALIVGAIVHSINDNDDPQYISRWELPGSCLETVRVRGRNIQVYNARCLRRAGYRNLPRYCQRDFRINGHRRTGFVAACLYDEGYRRGGSGRGGGYRYDSPPPYYNHNEPPFFAPPGIVPPFGLNPPRVSPPIARRHNVLPSECRMTYRQSGRRIQGYWGNCLRRSGLRDLPRNCRRTSTNGDTIYNAQCLRDAGYRRGRR